MLYYLYQVTNTINGKIYIGVHRTNNLEDGYMGSGTLLNRAINKHGVENFKKDILHYFENIEELFKKEREIVNESFLAREDVYNLRIGGDGGFDYINSNKEKYTELARQTESQWSKEKREQINKSKGLPGNRNGMFGTSRTGEANPMYGKEQSEYCRQRCSEVNSGKFAVYDLSGNIVKINSSDFNPAVHTPINTGFTAVKTADGKNIRVTTEEYATGVYQHTNSGRIHSTEMKQKISEKMSTLKWWTNDIENMRSLEMPKEHGWRPGRKSFKHR